MDLPSLSSTDTSGSALSSDASTTSSSSSSASHEFIDEMERKVKHVCIKTGMNQKYSKMSVPFCETMPLMNDLILSDWFADPIILQQRNWDGQDDLRPHQTKGSNQSHPSNLWAAKSFSNVGLSHWWVGSGGGHSPSFDTGLQPGSLSADPFVLYEVKACDFHCLWGHRQGRKIWFQKCSLLVGFSIFYFFFYNSNPLTHWSHAFFLGIATNSEKEWQNWSCNSWGPPIWVNTQLQDV